MSIGAVKEGERHPKSVCLVNSVSGIGRAIEHLIELQYQLGIHEEPEKVSPNIPMQEAVERDTSLVNVLNTLPQQIDNDCSRLHQVISKIQENLL